MLAKNKSYFSKTTSYQLPATRSSRGFTLVELLVVIAIVTIIASGMYVSSARFADNITLTNLVYDVSAAIRQNQSFGLAAKNWMQNWIADASNPISGFDVGYGVRFASDNNQQFASFNETSDSNGNGNWHCGGPSENSLTVSGCRSSSEYLSTYKISGRNTISKICAVVDSSNKDCYDFTAGSGTIHYLDLIFKRYDPDKPNQIGGEPDAYVSTDLHPFPNNYEGAEITFTTPFSFKKVIVVSAIGQIYVNDTGFVSNQIVNFTLSGGTKTIFGAREIHTFTTSGTLTVTGSGTVDVLVVGGGGGGGGAMGGGGGAGGLVYQDSLPITAGTYNITVGGGGAGGSGFESGNSGSNSVFGSITAYGGGGGGHYNHVAGINGGSGGGGGPLNANGGNGTAGQGYNGGSTNNQYAAGGGGGASANGQDGHGIHPGNGSDGVQYSISGTGNWYAGGGGGGGYYATCSDITSGGVGGGGSGSCFWNDNGTNGDANTGGGGGGAAYYSGNGGNGGSGIVIISFTPQQ